MNRDFEIRAIDNSGTVFWQEFVNGDESSAIAMGADVAASFTENRRRAVTEVANLSSGKTVAYFEPGWT